MRTLADEVNNQITAGRTTIKKSLPDMGEIDMRRVAPAGYVIAGVMVAAVVVGSGCRRPCPRAFATYQAACASR